MVKLSVLALAFPSRAIRAIQSDDRPTYRTLIPTLMLGGVFFIIFHSRFVVGTWVWQLPYAPIIIVQFSLAGVWNWLIGSIALTYTFRWASTTQPTRGQVDMAVFYLWLTWTVMPLFDIVHAFGLPTTLLVTQLPWAYFFVGHVSSLVMAPIRLAELYLILRRLGHMEQRRAWILALTLPFAARFLVEPSGGFFFLIANQLGYQVNLWVGQHLMISVALLYTIWWRMHLGHQPVPRQLQRVVLTMGLLVVITAAAWTASWAAPAPIPHPTPAILSPITLPMDVRDTLTSHVIWWTPDGSTKNDKGMNTPPLRVGPLLDGIDHEQVVMLPLVGMDGVARGPLRTITCQVELAVHDGLVRDGYPQLHCDLLIGGRRASRLSGMMKKNLQGQVEYIATWDRSDPGWTALERALRAGQVTASVTLGVHGGGDYTKPDEVEVGRIAVIAE